MISLRSLTVFSLVLVCSGLALYHHPALSNPQPAQKTAAIPVQVSSAVRRDVPIALKAVGSVMPFQSVGIRSRLDSQIMDVRFHDGDMVKKGQVLFVLDDRTLKSQQLQTEANIQRDKAQLENLKRQADRAQGLAKQGYASNATRDDAQAALDAQKAVLAADQAALENIRTQIGYAAITAPIDGRTGTINVTVGNTVKANDTGTLVTINQIQPILIQAALPQANFDAVRQAMQAGEVPTVATRSGNPDAARGHLQYIDNQIDPGTGTFTTRSVFSNQDEKLWPGMLVNLTVVVGQDKQVLVVPDVAIQHGQMGDYVYVIANGKAEKRDVKSGLSVDGMTVVTGSLKDNEQVAIDGLMSLKDGAAVSISASKAVAPAQNAAPDNHG